MQNFQISKLCYVIGEKIRFKWAMNTHYGDLNYTLYCQSERQALEIANTLDIAYPNGENFAALMELATKMLQGFSLIRTRNLNNFPYGFYFVKIQNKYHCIEYNEVKIFEFHEIIHIL